MKNDSKAVVFIDYENLRGNEVQQIDFVLNHKLVPNEVVVCKTYGSFNTISERENRLFEKYNIQVERIRSFNSNEKNGADIKIVVDAMEYVRKDQITHFVIVSGDVDFKHLYQKLKEMFKTILAFSQKKSMSGYLGTYCTPIVIPNKFIRTERPSIHKALEVHVRDELLKHVISAVRFFTSSTTVRFFNMCLYNACKDFHVKRTGLLGYCEQKKWLKFNRTEERILLSDQLVKAPNLICEVYSLIIELGISGVDRSLKYLPHGIHNLVVKYLAESLQKVTRGKTYSLVHFSETVVKEINNDALDTDKVQSILYLLKMSNVIVYSPDMRSFRRLHQYDSDHIVKLHNRLVYHTCYTSTGSLSRSEWQHILDKSLK